MLLQVSRDPLGLRRKEFNVMKMPFFDTGQHKQFTSIRNPGKTPATVINAATNISPGHNTARRRRR